MEAATHVSMRSPRQIRGPPEACNLDSAHLEATPQRNLPSADREIWHLHRRTFPRLGMDVHADKRSSVA